MFDFTTGREDGCASSLRRGSLKDVLLGGGAINSYLADGDAVVKVRFKNEEAARKDVEELEDPRLRGKVRVEVAGD